MYSPSLSSEPSSPSMTPGSAALEKVKNLKDLSVFKTPIGRAVRKKKVVYDEDTYIEKIGEIIERDFFPDLEKLRAQNEFLDAEGQNDVKKMRELFEKYSFGGPRTERLPSPATFDTPAHGENTSDTPCSIASRQSNASSCKSEKKEKKLKLDEFLAVSTSEDNASFEDILAENEKKHRLNNAWLYKNEAALAIENGSSQTLAIENGPSQKSIKPNVDTWAYKNKNYIMYIPDGVELTLEEQVELAKKKQEIVHTSTRLKHNPFNEQQNKEAISEIAKCQSKANDGKIGVDGKEIIRTDTPRVNGYSILGTPLPSPMPDGITDSPIMTWGQIEGTPFRLDGGDTPLLHASQGPSFKIAEPPKREKIAMRLAEKAGERNRDKKLKALDAARKSFATPSPRSTIDRLNSISPAARRLATQKLRVPITPSPQRTPMKSPLVRIRTPNTPRVNTPGSNRHGIGAKIQTPILTDNLLNLPQRQRAADFFK
ncbi:protein DGCR14 homolog [Trichogramma pretiosum]|uniref:protein DGCR14 homolog n=1 Tax=Trichogramma pretiosum TaxID=7493 RepID=UPI0006C9C015|nr:protein DGCR14 homolog [Trichogramma pretiosum]